MTWHLRTAFLTNCLLLANVADAQEVEIGPSATPADASAEQGTEPDRDVVILGRRVAGTAIADDAPIAVLDQDAIRSIGATSLKELIERLKPLTSSVDGSEPVYLLNGRRISGLAELGTLPPEAIERTEVLPESEAARFGFPPTVRVSNFVTKKHFRGLLIQQLAGSTTDGGGETNYVEANATRIDGPRRLSLSAAMFRHNPVLQSERDIVPDPDAPFAIGGIVTGVDGGSIDPALDARARTPVMRAPVPFDADARQRLSGYLPGAHTLPCTDIGAFRTLAQRQDMVNASATVASPIGKAIDGSLNLSMEAQIHRGLNGLAPAIVPVPGDSGFLPFTQDVLLYRYLPGIPLRQRNRNLNLHAGGTVQGGISRWSWNVTGSYDRFRSKARSDQGIVLDPFIAAVAAGADPLAPIPVDGSNHVLVDRRDTVTDTLVTKAVANGPLLRLPAGVAQLTVSADLGRSSSSGDRFVTPGQRVGFARTVKTGSLSAALPIASPDRDVLPFLGRFALSGMIGITDVSQFGQLVNYSYGATWSPKRRVQLSATISDALTPPAIALLTNPLVTSPNTPFFDFTNGRSTFVTTLTGGRAELLPERRRRSQFGIALSPIRNKELRLSLDYIDTSFSNQTASLGSATPAFQAAFPDAFIRDPAGRLVSVDLRPVNLASERDRQLRLAFNLSTPIGKAPPPPPATDDAPAGSPPPPPPKPRPTISAFVTTTLRLENRLVLRPGAAPLDLLDGATRDGTGGRPRWETEIDLRGTAGPLSLGLYGRLRGATRIRSELASADLFFSGRTWLVAYGSLDASKVVSEPWARNVSLMFTIENLLNDRINVTDRTGATPNRFQPAYIDPLGRSIRLGVRKKF